MQRTARLSRINGKLFKFVRWEDSESIDIRAYEMVFSFDCPLGSWKKIHTLVFPK